MREFNPVVSSGVARKEPEQRSGATGATYRPLNLADLRDNAAFWSKPETHILIEKAETRVTDEIGDIRLRYEESVKANTPFNETLVNADAAYRSGFGTETYNRTATTILQLAIRALNSLGVEGDERDLLAYRIVDDFIDVGPIAPFLRERSVTDIQVNAYNRVTVKQQGQGYASWGMVRFLNKDHVADVVSRILEETGKQCTPTTPRINARLVSGARIHVRHPNLNDGGNMHVSIRVPSPHTMTLIDLSNGGSMSREMVLELSDFARGRLTALYAGGTGCGKTTTLNAVTGAIFAREEDHCKRLFTIEDSPELRIHPKAANVAQVITFHGGGEAAGVTMADLLEDALRSDPDMIYIGEARNAAIIDWLMAAMTGHPGSATTIHADNAQDAFERIESMVAIGKRGVDRPLLYSMIAKAVDIIVFAEVGEDRVRRVTEIALVDRDGDDLVTRPIWKYNTETGQHERVFTPLEGEAVEEFRPGHPLPVRVARQMKRYAGTPTLWEDLEKAHADAREYDAALAEERKRR